MVVPSVKQEDACKIFPSGVTTHIVPSGKVSSLIGSIFILVTTIFVLFLAILEDNSNATVTDWIKNENTTRNTFPGHWTV